MRGDVRVEATAAREYLEALFGGVEAGLVEVRFRREFGMGQRFHRVSELDAAAREIADLAGQTDVFVGIVPRARRGGSRGDLVDSASVVWVDCDGEDAVAALDRFRPSPSLVIASGSGVNRHAYWLLSEAIALEEVERTNRRLAWALEADLATTDAGRILRPSGSLNHKRRPPRAVTFQRFEFGARIDLGGLVGCLADPPPSSMPMGKDGRRAQARIDDPLAVVAPAEYVERLTGQRVGRSRKVRCPFHEDNEPSLHVFVEPERGWYCFGCRRGGSIYDFAALLSGCNTRGAEFLALREELRSVFGI